MLLYSLFAAFIVSAFALITLKQQDIQNSHKIGTIANLYFLGDHRIMFRSDANTFGFINQTDGTLLAVYKLESDEYVIRFSGETEVIIGQNKTVNVFHPNQSTYEQSFETIFLQKHPAFTKIVDLVRCSDDTTLVLTDSFLMRFPTTFISLNQTRMKEDILIELINPQEKFFSLSQFFNIRTNQQDYYVTSLLNTANKSELCFRRLSDLNQSSICFQIPQDTPVLDIVSSSSYIYIEFAEYVLAMTGLLQFVQKIDSKPIQYYKGFMSLGSDYQYYDPSLRTFYNTKLIVERLNTLKIKTMKVEDNQLTVQSGTEQNITEIVTIQKLSTNNPRKAWSDTKDSNATQFRLYIEYLGGRLICYSVDAASHNYSVVWQMLTM